MAEQIKTKKPFGYWNLERCIEEARRYKTKSEWQKRFLYCMRSIARIITRS